MAKMEFETRFGTRTTTERSPLETGTRGRRVLVLADLSGRASRGVCEASPALLERPLIHVDIDKLDSVLRAFAPRIDLALGESASTLTLEFREFDDFHPDNLRRDLPLFAEFAASRARLLNSTTFASEAQRLTAAGAEVSAQEPDKDHAEDMSGTLERLLGKRPAAQTRPPRVGGVSVDLSRLIEDAVRPHVVANRSPQQDELLASVALAEAEQLRRILHTDEFQRLEAVWRSVSRMVNAADEDGPSIFLLDISAAELRNDLMRAETLQSSSLFRIVVEQETGESSWSLLVGDLTFGTSETDLACVATLGRLAQEAGAAFLAGADPSVLGCAGFDRAPVDTSEWALDADAAARWKAFRRSAAANWIGLVLPRVLLRLPYGEMTDAVDDPPFEESETDWSHEHYLWGNAAFAAATLILANEGLELTDLPAHIRDGVLQPCAEALIGDRAATRILDHGPMPLLSYRDRPAARLMRFQSLADPPTSLPGVTL